MQKTKRRPHEPGQKPGFVGTPSSGAELTNFGAHALCQKIAVDLPHCNMQTLCHVPAHADGARFCRRGKSGEQVGHVDHALRHLGDLQALVHRRLAQPGVGLVFRNALAAHQDALGAVDHLSA